MTANTDEGSLADRVRWLEAQIALLQRGGTAAQPNLRDLRDVTLSKVVGGQVAIYSEATGRWTPHVIVPPFNRTGALAVGVSDEWPVPFSLRARRLFVWLKVAGSTGTTVRLLRNGSVVAGSTVTLAAAAVGGGVSFDQVFVGPETDRMSVEITAAGTGAQGLVAVVA